MDAIDYISEALPYMAILWSMAIAVGICFWVAGK